MKTLYIDLGILWTFAYENPHQSMAKNPHFLGPTFLRQSFWHPKTQQKWHTPFIQPDLFIQLSLIFQKISTNFHLPSLFQPTLLRSFWGHMFSFSPGFCLKRQESQKATRPGRKLWSIELCSRLKANDHPNGGESSESLKDLNEKTPKKQHVCLRWANWREIQSSQNVHIRIAKEYLPGVVFQGH